MTETIATESGNSVSGNLADVVEQAKEAGFFLSRMEFPSPLWLVTSRTCRFAPFGPFDSQSEALDAAEEAIQQRHKAEVEYRRVLEEERVARCQIPSAFHGITLDGFKAKTKGLAAALEIAREYVRAKALQSGKGLL